MIKTEIKQNTAIITLHRPEKRNALHPKLVEQLKGALNDANENEEVKSVIITGEGSSFCSGADLAYLKDLNDNTLLENEQDSDLLAELFLGIYKFPKPTIAAVNGPAIAGGCGLASVCDIIVANPEVSKFGYSEVRIGFIPAIVSIFLLKRIGEGYTKQLLLTGETISGRRAYEIGLANYLSENVIEESLKVAGALNKNSLFSVETTKKMIHSISGLNLDSAIQFCVNLNVISRTSGDFIKGLQKFLN